MFSSSFDSSSYPVNPGPGPSALFVSAAIFWYVSLFVVYDKYSNITCLECAGSASGKCTHPPSLSNSFIYWDCTNYGADGFGSVPALDSLNFCSRNSFLLKPLSPIKVNVSHINYVLTYLSNILELLKEGRQLTSRTHGLNSSSNIMSNPYTSKQHFWRLPSFSKSETMLLSALRSVLIITSLHYSNGSTIFCTLCLFYISCLFRYFRRKVKLHLDEDSWVGSSSASSWFKIPL